MTTDSAAAPVPLPAPVVSHSARRRITHISPALDDALAPFIRAATPGEHRSALTALVLLATAVDAEAGDGEHPEPQAPVDCAAVSALGQDVRLHVFGADGGLLAAFADEDLPSAFTVTE
ncbi:hypothetical protein AB0K09_20360 [Streptomyces sp. NPDC049577]|uniref:hypothetical protein n=1 Tax=Streptomyces sp. NPDC049577 TaxID=3155153 RepID=UPI003420F7AD